MRANETNLYGCVLVALAVVAMIFGQTASADTTVGGLITADTHWTTANGPYIATQSILVADGATLTIDPGVEIRFDPQRALTVTSGQVIARGTEAQPIRFTANIVENRWGYIGFGDGSIDATFDGAGNYTGGSIIEHAIVEYAGGTDLQGAIRVDHAAPFVSRSLIRENSNGAIYGTCSEGLRMSGNRIVDNGTSFGGGVHLVASTNAVFDRNIITGNSANRKGGGIYLSGSDNSIFIGNTITSNLASSDGGGIYLYSSDNAVLTDNVIADNSTTGDYGGGVCIDSHSDNAVIRGNTITGNSGRGGAGVRLDYARNVLLENNTISDNAADTYGGGVYATHCDSAVFADNLISDNSTNFEGGGIYLGSSDGATLTGDTITGNSAAHGAGLSLCYSKNAVLIAERIMNNVGDGVYVRQFANGRILSAEADNPTWIYGNQGYQVYNDMDFAYSYDPDGEGNIDARNVYWGTTDETEIQAGIYDFFDDAGKGIVFYDPWAVPEPATLFLLAFGGLAVIRRRRKQK